MAIVYQCDICKVLSNSHFGAKLTVKLKNEVMAQLDVCADCRQQLDIIMAAYQAQADEAVKAKMREMGFLDV